MSEENNSPITDSNLNYQMTPTESAPLSDSLIDESSGNNAGAVGRWTDEEHNTFVEGLKLHSRDWRAISKMIPTRSVVQIRTHAQKFFQKLSKEKNTDANEFKIHGTSTAQVPSALASSSSPPRQPVHKVPRPVAPVDPQPQRIRASSRIAEKKMNVKEEEDEESNSPVGVRRSRQERDMDVPSGNESYSSFSGRNGATMADHGDYSSKRPAAASSKAAGRTRLNHPSSYSTHDGHAFPLQHELMYSNSNGYNDPHLYPGSGFSVEGGYDHMQGNSYPMMPGLMYSGGYPHVDMMHMQTGQFHPMNAGLPYQYMNPGNQDQRQIFMIPPNGYSIPAHQYAMYGQQHQHMHQMSMGDPQFLAHYPAQMDPQAETNAATIQGVSGIVAASASLEKKSGSNSISGSSNPSVPAPASSNPAETNPENLTSGTIPSAVSDLKVSSTSVSGFANEVSTQSATSIPTSTSSSADNGSNSDSAQSAQVPVVIPSSPVVQGVANRAVGIELTPSGQSDINEQSAADLLQSLVNAKNVDVPATSGSASVPIAGTPVSAATNLTDIPQSQQGVGSSVAAQHGNLSTPFPSGYSHPNVYHGSVPHPTYGNIPYLHQQMAFHGGTPAELGLYMPQQNHYGGYPGMLPSDLPRYPGMNGAIPSANMTAGQQVSHIDNYKTSNNASVVPKAESVHPPPNQMELPMYPGMLGPAMVMGPQGYGYPMQPGMDMYPSMYHTPATSRGSVSTVSMHSYEDSSIATKTEAPSAPVPIVRSADVHTNLS